MHAEHALAGHAQLDAAVGVLLLDLLDRRERGQQVAVAGGAGGVEVQAVGAGLPHALGDEHHVGDGVLDGLHLRVASLVDAAERHAAPTSWGSGRRASSSGPGPASRRTAAAR